MDQPAYSPPRAETIGQPSMSGPGTQTIPSTNFVYRGPDRRRGPTPRFSRFALWGGRRRKARRGSEREGSFVDLYGWRLFLMIVWIALMNIGDSFFTLVHLQAGGVELNPVAKML